MELGKREYLQNGGDILLVTGPSGAGKTTVLAQLKYAGFIENYEVREINDVDYILASVQQAEENGEGGFYWKINAKEEKEGFVITDQKLVERAYHRFFQDIANLEYTGYPVVVEWAAGTRKEGTLGNADFSYETIGKILTQYEDKIIPRIRAVLKLQAERETREARNTRRTGEEARSQTVGNLFYGDDFEKIKDMFPEEKIFCFDNQWGFLGVPAPVFDKRYLDSGPQVYPENSQFYYRLFSPYASLAMEISKGKARSDLFHLKETEFYQDYPLLRELFEQVRAFEEAAKTAGPNWTYSKVTEKMRERTRRDKPPGR